MAGSVGKGILRGAAIISAFALLGKVLGFGQKLVISPRFGTGLELDAYTLAFSSVVFIIGMFPQQLLQPLLPLFMEKREKEGEAAAWRLAGSVCTILIAVLLVVTVLGMALAPKLAEATSSFKDPKGTLLAGRLVFVMMPAVLFMGLFAFLTLILQSYKRFAPSPLGDTINKIVLIGCLVALFGRFGIFSLAIGVVAGSAAGLVAQVIGLRDKIRQIRFGVHWRDPALKHLFLLMLPLLLPFVIAQVRTVIDYKFASGMAEGSTSGIFFARGLVDTLILLGPTALGAAIYPYFSEWAGNREALGDMLMRWLRLMVFIFVPVTLALILLGLPIVQLLFQRGKFTEASVALTVAPFTFYTLGLTIFALEIILMRFYFSVKNTLVPAVIGAACVFVHLGVILLTRHAMQNSSMALAATISKGVKVAVMLAWLGFLLPSLQGRKNGLFLLKMTLAAGGMALAMTMVLRAFPAMEAGEGGGLTRLVRLGLTIGGAGAAGALAFVTVAFVLKMEETALLWTFLKKRRPSP
jgi:putative peptidoglycan lipid II flippase